MAMHHTQRVQGGHSFSRAKITISRPNRWNPSSMTKALTWIYLFPFAQEDNPNSGAKITRR
eukprot:2002381-Prymnesium_polylepis.1